MIRARRFVYNAEADVVEEVGTSPLVPTFSEQYDRAKAENAERRSPATGHALKQAALERAERREFAHTRYGTESRWRE